ncbi:hypothetical protein [Rudaeicoccus suwonensis]|uniref:hypothetical protein n=1 Tax=Rudaeicoccus suwonensis TaxID=657409 RepID=UPI00119FB67E|nr:hypothetical protein [Rudaeicoccus suwonensis]
MPTTPFADLDAPDSPPLVQISQLHLIDDRTRVRVRGKVVEWQLKRNKGGELWAALTLGSESTDVTCLFFPKVFQSVAENLPRTGIELEITAHLNRREHSIQLIADCPCSVV